MARRKMPRGEYPRKLDADCKQRLASIDDELRANAAQARAVATAERQRRRELEREQEAIRNARDSLVA